MKCKQLLIIITCVSFFYAFLTATAQASAPVRLKAGHIDTKHTEKLTIPSKSKRYEKNYYIVQAEGKKAKQLKKAATTSGAKVLSYLPDDAFLIEISSKKLEKLRTNKSVRCPFYSISGLC